MLSSTAPVNVKYTATADTKTAPIVTRNFKSIIRMGNKRYCRKAGMNPAKKI